MHQLFPGRKTQLLEMEMVYLSDKVNMTGHYNYHSPVLHDLVILNIFKMFVEHHLYLWDA